MIASVSADLIGRVGVNRFGGEVCTPLLVDRVVVVHLPSVQSGVVLPAVVRTGIAVVMCTGEREAMVFWSRGGGGVTRPRGPALDRSFRGGRVNPDVMRAPLLSPELVRGGAVLPLRGGEVCTTGRSTSGRIVPAGRRLGSSAVVAMAVITAVNISV